MVEADAAKAIPVIAFNPYACFVCQLSRYAVVEADMDGTDAHPLRGNVPTPVGNGFALFDPFRILDSGLPSQRLPEVEAGFDVLGLGVETVDDCARADEVEVRRTVVERRVGACEAPCSRIDAASPEFLLYAEEAVQGKPVLVRVLREGAHDPA